MKEVSKEFLSTLFDEGEEICISHDGYAYKSLPQDSLNGPITLISNNPNVKPRSISENDITLVAINPITGPRNDQSVTAYRSFLIECDDGSLEDQLKYVEDSGMPYSVCVFSGNKSLHFGIVLDEPYTHESIWRTVNEWILKIMSRADQQTKNPSRSIRFPGNVRKDGRGLRQVLIKNKGRVKKTDLNIWLNKHIDKKPKKVKAKSQKGGIVDVTNIPDWIRDYWDNGVTTERNKTWFSIACWFAEKDNFDAERFIEYWDNVFVEEYDFTRQEWETTVKSAFKRIQGT